MLPSSTPPGVCSAGRSLATQLNRPAQTSEAAWCVVRGKACGGVRHIGLLPSQRLIAPIPVAHGVDCAAAELFSSRPRTPSVAVDKSQQGCRPPAPCEWWCGATRGQERGGSSALNSCWELVSGVLFPRIGKPPTTVAPSMRSRPSGSGKLAATLAHVAPCPSLAGTARRLPARLHVGHCTCLSAARRGPSCYATGRFARG